MFNQPSGSGFLPAKQMQGHLVLFTQVHGSEMKPDNLRQGQLQRVVTVDYVDLDEPGQPIHVRALVGNIGITNKLTDGATNVLGRIGSTDTGKGQPAHILLPYDETGQDVARATQWVTAYTAGQIQVASNEAQQQAQAPVAPQAPAQQYGAPQPQQYPAPQPQPGYGQPVAPQGYPVQGQPQQYAAPPVPQPAPQAAPGQPDFAAVQQLLAQQGLATTPVAGQQQPGY